MVNHFFVEVKETCDLIQELTVSRPFRIAVWASTSLSVEDISKKYRR